jgi:putative ATPase
MKSLGYAKGYQHAHAQPDAVTDMDCLPESLRGKSFYEPSDRGFERKLQERLQWLAKKRGKLSNSAEEKKEQS